jgi:hypothetical protein
VDTREQAPIGPPWDDLPGQYSNLSLELPTDLPIDDWLELCERLNQSITNYQFWLGDAINHGEAIYGDEYYQLFDHIEAEEGTLRNYAYVARQILPSMRREGIDWTHYREIAPIKDTYLQLELLDRIETEGMTTRQVAEAKNVGQQSAEELETATCPCCHGSGRVAAEKVEQVKRALAEHHYHDDLA